MSLYSAEKRYLSGRRLMLGSAAVYALSRALTYLPNPDRDTPLALQTFSTIIPEWVFAALWGAVVCLCITDLIRGVGRIGISALVGVMAFWGAIYGFSYVTTVMESGWGSREWSHASNFLFLGGVIMGLLVKVGALKPSKSHL